MTLDLHVAVALDPSLLTSLHRCIAPVGIDSSDAEGLAAAHLTSSLDNSTLIAPMPLSDTSVKPVLLSFPHLAQYARPITLMQWRRFFRQPSDVPMVGHRLNRCSRNCIFSSNSSRRSFGLDMASRLYPLYFGTSTTDWNYHLDGGLDMTSRR